MIHRHICSDIADYCSTEIHHNLCFVVATAFGLTDHNHYEMKMHRNQLDRMIVEQAVNQRIVAIAL